MNIALLVVAALGVDSFPFVPGLSPGVSHLPMAWAPSRGVIDIRCERFSTCADNPICHLKCSGTFTAYSIFRGSV